ncbi:fasciclin domain-containing protein [Nocardiopsis sp. LOL_012]|uniref:fasciclin domain-containing protein n=1 Tax=Nocardiopsis sp. LOL_012 TaxID=3345409 RepID=UPI003A8C1182
MPAKNALTVTASAALLALGLAACGGSTGEEAVGSASPTATDGTGMTEGTETTDDMEATGDDMAATEPFGTACADIPADSMDSMAQEPVATAASDNPDLSTLVSAIEEADMVDTLNSAEDITVFAPTNEAFEAIPQEDLDALLADQEQLTNVLNYHVVEGKQDPTALESGTFTSLQGEDITTEGSGEEYTVNGEAQVVCGNIQTSNATVYMIDGVLMPS